MRQSGINLKILLPFEVFAQKSGVSRIVADTQAGSYGFLPHRRDCVAALVPGILIYEDPDDGEVFVAIDEGIFVKAGDEVTISTRGAVAGNDLGQLRDTVEKRFLSLNEQEKTVRSVMAQLESDFVRRLGELSHG